MLKQKSTHSEAFVFFFFFVALWALLVKKFPLHESKDLRLVLKIKSFLMPRENQLTNAEVYSSSLQNKYNVFVFKCFVYHCESGVNKKLVAIL